MPATIALPQRKVNSLAGWLVILGMLCLFYWIFYMSVQAERIADSYVEPYGEYLHASVRPAL